MPSQASNVRRAAVSALRAWAKGHTYMDSLIERHAGRNGLSRQDRALLQSIVYGVLRHRRLLDHWIGKLRRGKLDHETRDVLRVGLCQLLILGIADHAVVNETVNCAKTPVRGLINAVLRQAIVRRKRLMEEMVDLPPAVQFSHPDWLYNRWRKTFGKNDAIALMEWNNQPAKVICRVNTLKDGARETVDAYEKSTALEKFDGFYQIDGLPPGEWMKNGLIYIQDPATCHSVELLKPTPGETILDACAAPGGKATMIAAAMNNEGEILCTDSNEKRLPRLEENLQQLGVSIAKTQEHDWTQPSPAEWHGRFDAILLDVPCSNTGVLRRRIDARWRLRTEDIEELTKIQEQILSHALPCLRAGGRIVYSTCSIDPEENRELIDRFFTNHPDWKLADEHISVPFNSASDGAYAARLEHA
ncbi:ribosomal RNA small subunit methyltransferase B [Oceaniferula spumae]|uniref:16S rRNA (cytosine(967)-C(5))-methyltransferase n=1 Tax=Oceaniferula spumae TaxID=2979115 RepID=A0AAT9FGE4_9BACT